MRYLKQSTSVDLPIGPFLDATTGVDAETGLTITQPDIRLKKNGAAWAQKNAAQTLSHEENGFYEVTLDATDTDTLGLLRLAVFESGSVPVWEDFMVMPANVWDAMFGADRLEVHAAEITAGLITAAAIATDAIDADALATDAVNEIAAAVGGGGGGSPTDFDSVDIEEPAAVPSWPATPAQILGWLLALSRNKVTVTGGTQLLRNDADDATIATSVAVDAGGTTTRPEWS